MQSSQNQNTVSLDASADGRDRRDKLVAAICGAVNRAIPVDADIPDSGDLPIHFEVRGRTKRTGARVIVSIDPAHLRKTICVKSD